MKLGLSLGAVGLGLLVCACGAGKDANVGSDSNKHVSKDGGVGGASNGGDTAGGGATQSTGGAVTGGGGTSHASGGAAQGGAMQATGGAVHSTGGTVANGGATQATGGGSGSVACGKNTCAAGDICCSPSCGICGPKGGACPAIACQPQPVDAGPCIDTVACIKGTVWSSTQCKCVPTTTGGTCTTAADCHLVSNYCDGCNCLSLTSGQKEPACSGTTVQCLVDPCSTKSAACVGGHCTTQ